MHGPAPLLVDFLVTVFADLGGHLVDGFASQGEAGAQGAQQGECGARDESGGEWHGRFVSSFLWGATVFRASCLYLSPMASPSTK